MEQQRGVEGMSSSKDVGERERQQQVKEREDGSRGFRQGLGGGAVKVETVAEDEKNLKWGEP